MEHVPSNMTAIMAIKAGGPEVLTSKAVETPDPGPKEVLIKVHAAGVNRPDAKQRAGDYPPPPGVTEILGLEVAGTIVEVGEGVDPKHLNREVCALVAGGGYAEYVVAPLPQVLPIPAGLTMIEAAAVPETTFTVWTNMIRIGRLKKGEGILIHGGTSGIGTTAIQIAKALGATVYATAGTDEKVKRCLDLGADAAINYHSEDFSELVLEMTSGRGVDAIVDLVCADYLNRNLACLAEDGRLIVVSFLGGGSAEVDFKKLVRNRHTICGSTLRPQSVEQKEVIAADLIEHVWPMIVDGRYRPLIQSVHDLEDAAAAHQEMEDGHHVGKIVLKVC
jgi:NADPH2:quinone reductase